MSKHWRRAGTASLVLAMFAAACAPSEQPASSGSAPGTNPVQLPADPTPPTTVQGWVTAGSPVRDATVVVTGPDQAVLGVATTDRFGRFETDVASATALRVTATGGTVDGAPQPFPLRLVVNPDDPESTRHFNQLDVGVFSTLVTKQIDRTGADEETAEGHVNAVLGLSQDADSEWITGTQPKAFSLATFHAEASGGNADESDVDALADRIAADPTTDGSAPATPTAAGTAATPSSEATLHPASLPTTSASAATAAAAADHVVTSDAASVPPTRAFAVADPSDDFPEGYVADVVQDFLKGQAKDLITKWVGGGDQSGEILDELKAMEAQLDQIQGALQQLDAETAHLAAVGVFENAVTSTNDLRGGIEYAERQYLEPLAATAITLREAQASGGDVAAAQKDHDDKLANFKSNYNVAAGGAFIKLNTYLVPGVGGTKSIVGMYGDVLRGNRFFDADNSTDLFNVYDYFASWQAVATHLEIEYQSAINGAVQTAVDTYDDLIAQQKAALPTRLTTQGVVVDFKYNLMWQGTPAGAARVERGKTGLQMPGGAANLPGYTWSIAPIGDLEHLVEDRGTQSPMAYVVSISTPKGFARDVWGLLDMHPLPLLSSTNKTATVYFDRQGVTVATEKDYVAAAIATNGRSGIVPDPSWSAFDTPQAADRWFAANGVGETMNDRHLDAGETYA